MIDQTGSLAGKTFRLGPADMRTRHLRPAGTDRRNQDAPTEWSLAHLYSAPPGKRSLKPGSKPKHAQKWQTHLY